MDGWANGYADVWSLVCVAPKVWGIVDKPEEKAGEASSASSAGSADSDSVGSELDISMKS